MSIICTGVSAVTRIINCSSAEVQMSYTLWYVFGGVALQKTLKGGAVSFFFFFFFLQKG